MPNINVVNMTGEVVGELTLSDKVFGASVNEAGEIISTISNASLTDAKEIKCQIADFSVSSVTAEILVSENVRDHNTFDNKEVVKTKVFTDFTLTEDGFIANVPACSVVKFIIK